MKYYKITPDGDEPVYIESKTPLSDRKAKAEAVDQNLIDSFDAQTAIVEEIDEEVYEENV